MEVPFCTPIVRENNCFLNTVEQYLWFGSTVVHVIPGTNDGIEGEEKTAWYLTALKVLTMILTAGILPLLALIIKAIGRCQLDKVTVIPVIQRSDAEEVCQQTMTRFEPFFQQITSRAEEFESDPDPGCAFYVDRDLQADLTEENERFMDRYPETPNLLDRAIEIRMLAMNPRESGVVRELMDRLVFARVTAISANAMARDEPMYQRVLARARAIDAIDANNPNPPEVDPAMWEAHDERNRQLCAQNLPAYRLYQARTTVRTNELSDQCSLFYRVLFDLKNDYEGILEHLCRQALEQDELMCQQILARAHAIWTHAPNPPEVDPALWAAHEERKQLLRAENPAVFRRYASACSLRFSGNAILRCPPISIVLLDLMRNYANSQRAREVNSIPD